MGARRGEVGGLDEVMARQGGEKKSDDKGRGGEKRRDGVMRECTRRQSGEQQNIQHQDQKNIVGCRSVLAESSTKVCVCVCVLQ